MPTFKIKLFKSKTLADGTHPIVLQVIHNRKPAIITLGYSCLEKEWDNKANKFKRSFNSSQKKNRILRDILNKADSITDEIKLSGKPFTIKLFKSHFQENKKTIDVYSFMNILIQEFEELGKISNRNIYRTLKNRLIAFSGKSSLVFPDIDKRFLDQFEVFLRKNGCENGGVANYMRTLRSTYNKAIDRKFVKENFYPFTTARKREGYSLSHLKSTAQPRAISFEDMEKIKNLVIENYPVLEQSYYYFLFSYYTRGMNFKDMALLKWENIYGGRIQYIRSKTKGTFSISITKHIQSILDQFPKTEEQYIFPILSSFHLTPQQIKNRVDKCRQKFNKDLKQIAQICNIQASLTSYVARHTFATTLKKKNVDIALISESLGHQNIATTKAYLKKFENDEIDKLDKLL